MKICPICDHELTGMFCPSCRKMVSEPLILSDGIYLNKPHSNPDVLCEFTVKDRLSTFLNRRHPANEENCSYHEAGKTAFGGLKDLMSAKSGGKIDFKERMEAKKQELKEKYGAGGAGFHVERSAEDPDSLMDLLKKHKQGGNK